MSFYRLRYHLDEFVHMPIDTLNTSFSASPPMRQYICLEFPLDIHDDKVIARPNHPITLPGVRELHWLMNEWLFDKKQIVFIKLENLVDKLQRLIETDGDAKSHVSSFVEGHIFDLGIMSQCMKQIDLYQPWAAGFQNAMWQPELEKELQREYIHMTDIFEPYAVKCVPLFTGQLGRLGDPSDGKFTYPINRRSNEANTDLIRQAEINLDTFWAAADRAISPYMTKRLQILLANRELQRTPPWMPLTKDNTLQNKRMIEMLTQPMSEIHLQLEKSTESTIDRSTPDQKSSKAKTRGTADPARMAQTEQMEEPAKPELSFEVDKRALKVFRTLFYTPSTSSQPGEIPWADFLHAMTSTGFAAEKLYGSVWQFTPTMLDVESSIQFHEPHPSPKLPFTWARRIGRRLSRNYGWHGQLFRLAE
jgi:hypothetical protein